MSAVSVALIPALEIEMEAYMQEAGNVFFVTHEDCLIAWSMLLIFFSGPRDVQQFSKDLLTSDPIAVDLGKKIIWAARMAFKLKEWTPLNLCVFRENNTIERIEFNGDRAFVSGSMRFKEFRYV
jgi:hypothetical protein